MNSGSGIDGVSGMNVPKNRVMALQGVKKTLVGGKTVGFMELTCVIPLFEKY